MQGLSVFLLVLVLAGILTINFAVSHEAEEILTYAQPRDIWSEDRLLDYFDHLNLSDHTTQSFDNYINKPEDWLRTRLRRNADLYIATSYFDLETAKDCIKEIVFQNSEQIIKWLNNPESTLQRQFISEFKEPIGHGFSRTNTASLQSLSKARLVLAKKSNEIQIINSYPIE